MCDATLLKLLLRSSSRSAIHWVNTLIWNDQSPLFSAIYLDSYECVKLLLDCGANPNHQTLEGDSPLDYCDKYNVSQEIRDVLIQYGATSPSSLSEINQDMIGTQQMAVLGGVASSKPASGI